MSCIVLVALLSSCQVNLGAYAILTEWTDRSGNINETMQANPMNTGWEDALENQVMSVTMLAAS